MDRVMTAAERKRDNLEWHVFCFLKVFAWCVLISILAHLISKITKVDMIDAIPIFMAVDLYVRGQYKERAKNGR